MKYSEIEIKKKILEHCSFHSLIFSRLELDVDHKCYNTIIYLSCKNCGKEYSVKYKSISQRSDFVNPYCKNCRVPINKKPKGTKKEIEEMEKNKILGKIH